MKIYLSIVISTVVSVLSAFGTDYKFDIPGSFLVSVHGTLHVTAPDGWSVITAYNEEDATKSPPPQFPGPVIEAKNSSGAEINILPMDIEERSVIDLSKFGKDISGSLLPMTTVQGPYAKGSIYFLNSASPTRAYGDLETGRIILSFVAILSDTNDWMDIQNILESFRFEENKVVQQSGAAYVAQSAPSADP
jgi:hypothetical protein